MLACSVQAQSGQEPLKPLWSVQSVGSVLLKVVCLHVPPPPRYVELCERFSRSEAMRRYHNLYPDQLPDLREATDTGRRHIINGYHAYFYH